MAREKKAEEREPIVAGDEPLRQSEEEAPAGKTRTTDMVRAATAAGHATAKVGLPCIEQNSGVDMKPGNFSVTKSTIERGNKKAAASEPAPKRTYKRRQPKAEVPPAPAHTNGHMSPSEAARSVKDLIDKLGVAEVRNLVELFGG